jgi:hypothetical protein
VTYPNTGVARFTLEVKAVGTPRHPLSPKQKPIGRWGSADLAKRVTAPGLLASGDPENEGST